jgi:hypothetical protein
MYFLFSNFLFSIISLYARQYKFNWSDSNLKGKLASMYEYFSNTLDP